MSIGGVSGDPITQALIRGRSLMVRSSRDRPADVDRNRHDQADSILPLAFSIVLISTLKRSPTETTRFTSTTVMASP